MLKIVETKNGKVRGIAGNNARITAFKGIPFAAPPVGDNRWRAPQPVENWEGILDAYTFAPISVQDQPAVGTDIYCKEWHVDPDIPMDEDCLYLNVWTNAKSGDDKLPVLVWFFGGAFQWGYTAEMEFCGENIAKRGIVVVSVNYRLATLGFLAHPDLTKESPDAPSNFGLLDQLSGLKWVRDNIAAFGGDYDNVTIAGQSAGGGSVLNHIVSPKSRGYFNKAVILSGIIRNPYMKDDIITPSPISRMEKLGEEFFKYLGVSTIKEARELDAYYIREKYAEFAQSHPRFVPNIDGVFTMDEPFKMYLNGTGNDIPMIAGNTEDEFEFFNPDGRRVQFIELSVKAALAMNKTAGYYYQFEADIPGDDKPGTFHSVDLWFWFETLAGCFRPYTGRHYDLARQMCNYFTNFIKNGDPNGHDADGTPMVKWEPYTAESKNEMHFTADGCKSAVQSDEFKDALIDVLYAQNTDDISLEKVSATDTSVSSQITAALEVASGKAKKKQAFNPYLPSWEYIPDGEPYVFGDRVYVYGSHDIFNGHGFCLDDYVCYSAPVNDLGDWRYEGVIYKRTDDALNERNNMCLYAPDVVQGEDGRYYLYYVLDKVDVVSVCVCDEPAGRYKFYGYVHYEDGTLLGRKNGDEPQFDPGVIMKNGEVFLYTGFCGQGDKSRSGAMLTVLDKDMLTIKRGPRIIVPGSCYSKDTEFEGHAFFEAPSIREFDGKYYFIYSSEVMHELCYAMADELEGEYHYGGVIVSNCDLGIDSYKDADKIAAYGSNNHGSLIQIGDKRYIFYHRHTNNTWFSRQGCAEEVIFTDDGHILQSELTSCGLNGGPLNDTEEYPAYIVCNLFNEVNEKYVDGLKIPYVTQDGGDGDKIPAHVSMINIGTVLGYKYFDFKGVKKIQITARGYAKGEFLISTSIGGQVLGRVPMEYSTIWETYEADCLIPDGVSALYITFANGHGNASIKSFKFLH